MHTFPRAAVRRRHVTVPVTYAIVRDGDKCIAICPALDLTTYGTSEDEVRAAFDDMLRVFVEEMTMNGTLDQELIRLGWGTPGPRRRGYIPPTRTLPADLAERVVQSELQARIILPV